MGHLIRLLSTTSGADKSFMLVQYSAILVSSLLNRGTAKKSYREVAVRLAVLAKLLSDARTTYRLWDLLTIIRWFQSLSAMPASCPKLVQIERLQVIMMLIYYPLEHLYFLATKRVLPIPSYLISKAAIYSCRAWAAYTALKLAQLWGNLNQLRTQWIQLKSKSTKGTHTMTCKTEDKVELKRIHERRAATINGLIVNLAYAPLTLHWSLPNGLYASETLTGIFGVIAAIGQLNIGWKASVAAE